MATHHQRALERSLTPPKRELDRSIYAALGLPVENIGKVDHCQACGKKLPDGDGTRTTSLGGRKSYGLRVCDWCDVREARTQYVGFLHDQMIFARRSTFRSIEWQCLNTAADGAAWKHGRRGLLVIEGLALEHPRREEDPDLERHLAALPVVEREGGKYFAVVRTRDGTTDVYRTELIPPEGTSDWQVETLKPDSPEIRAAIFDWNRSQGWEWWHHVSLSRGGARGAPPAHEELCFVRDQFVTPERECYQVFPPSARYVNLHPGVLHLWHCLEPKHGAHGRVLPQFDGLVMGVRPI